MYAAVILAATSRRSPVAGVSLAAGSITGLAAAVAISLAIYEVASNDNYAGLLLLTAIVMTFLLAALTGVAAAWRLSGIEDPQDRQELRAARLRQGLLAGSVAGVVCGLVLTDFFVAGVVMMLIGPLAGLGGGALGGAIAADRPHEARPDRIRDAGLFVFKS